MRSVNECLLVPVIDLEWPLAYEEACPWKHVMNALRYTFDHEPDEATTLIAIGDPLQVDTELLTRLQEPASCLAQPFLSSISGQGVHVAATNLFVDPHR